MGKKIMIKSVGIIMAISIVSKFTGFLRDTLIASAFGATYIADAYSIAMTIPYILFSIMGVAIGTTFIPLLSESYMNNGKKNMISFANSVINLVMVISIIILFLAGMNVTILVRVIAPNLPLSTFNMAVTLTRYTIFSVAFMSMTNGFMAILQIFNEFIPGALTGFVVSIPIIIYILLGKQYGIYGLTIVSVLGFGLQVLIQVPWLRKNKYKYSFKIDLHDKRIKTMFQLILPVLIGTGVSQLNILVDRMVASGLPEGSIASFDYAYKLSTIVYSVFVYSIITIIYPNLSKIRSKDMILFKKYICKSINIICMVMVPASLSMIVLQRDIVEIVFKHGAFDERAVIMTSSALGYLAIGMVFLGIRDVCDRAFYSLNDTKTSMINGIIGMVCCISSNLITVRFIGIRGLALSLTISAIVSTVLLLRSLRKKIGGINIACILKSNFKITISSIFMIIFIGVFKQIFSSYFSGVVGKIVLFLIYIVVGISTYIIGIKLLKLEEFLEAETIIKNKFKESKIRNNTKDNMA